jgi:hypothetical protein
MRTRKALLAVAAPAAALACAQPAEAQNLGERIGGALNRGAQVAGRAAERAGSATGAAADRGLAWARRKARGGREAKPARER